MASKRSLRRRAGDYPPNRVPKRIAERNFRALVAYLARHHRQVHAKIEKLKPRPALTVLLRETDPNVRRIVATMKGPAVFFPELVLTLHNGRAIRRWYGAV
jgi:hypothetical protein